MKRSLTPHDRIMQAAKEMRRTATPAEKALWAELRDRRLAGLKFYRQDIIGPFIADFSCASAHLVVEIDGDIHDYQKDEDAARTRWLEDYGYRVIRFRNEEVLNELERVLSQIAAVALTPGPSPDSGGGVKASRPGSFPDSGKDELPSTLYPTPASTKAEPPLTSDPSPNPGGGMKASQLSSFPDSGRDELPRTLNPTPDSGSGGTPPPPILAMACCTARQGEGDGGEGL